MPAASLILAVLASQLQPIHFTLDESDIGFRPWFSEELVTLPGCSSPFVEGEPSLPGMGYSLVIPLNSELEGVEVEVLATAVLPGSHAIAPVFPLPVDESPRFPAPRSAAYSAESFPAEAVQAVSTGSKSGFRIASFTYVPFSWDPRSGELAVVTDAMLTPVLGSCETPGRTLTSRQVDLAAEALEAVVDNPGMIRSFSPPVRSGEGTPWVVVSAQEHFETLQPLVDYRNVTHGASFVSTEYIYDQYPGRDTQEQIRNYLIDAYENQGLVYALIVGDFGETTRLSSLNISGTPMESVSDLYFSDLDGTWDLDGDSKFGELNDGLDYYSDIYTGRFSTDVPSRLQTMVEKTIAYETSSPSGSWRTTALLAGAGLWVDEPPGYWGSFVCDSIDTRIPSSWTVHKLYEDYSSHPDNQIELYNQGVSYSSLNGHGNEAGVWWFYGPSTEIVTNSNYHEMTNDGMPVVFHSMACHPGHLQDLACIAERLMFWPQGGGIAVMFNSHWGIGTPPATGPSEWLEIFFAQTLFEEQQNELGVTHALSKDAFRASMSITYQNWILQENNFLGDPAVLFAAGQTGIEEPDEPGTGMILSIASANPSAGVLTLCCAPNGVGDALITVTDLTGRTVVTLHSGNLPAHGLNISADLSHLPAGCYRIVLCGKDITESVPLVLLR